MDSIKFTIASINDLFYLSGNTLFAKTVFNYEEKSSYSLTLTATDDGSPPLNISANIPIKVGSFYIEGKLELEF